MEPRAIRPWTSARSPQKVLAMRFYALGDTVITLPYLQSFRENLPTTQLDFLTHQEAASIPQHLDLFQQVFVIGGGRNIKRQWLSTVRLLPYLLAQGYDVVLDLQRNALSRMVRRLLRPVCYSEFDRFSPLAAGERNRLSIEAAGLGPVPLNVRLSLRNPELGRNILQAHGWHPTADLVILNPAGLFVTRRWPIENYVAFARLWLTHVNPQTQFVLLGLPHLAERVQYLRQELPGHVLDLLGKTTAAEAFAIVQRATLVLSEDSGLMHMAWVNGRPTVALLGSTRSDWARPLGEHALCLDSADLPCGNCMQVTCQWGDVRCLTRYTPTFVFERARALVNGLRQGA